MQITPARSRFLAAMFAVFAGTAIGCAEVPEREPAERAEADGTDGEEAVDSTSQELMSSSGGYPSSYSYTTTSTQDIVPPTVCRNWTSLLSDAQLQERASAVFEYLSGGSAPTNTYSCQKGGSLNYTQLDAIRTALGYGNETAKIKNCFFTTNANNCGSNLKASHHILTYQGTSSAVVNALKGLAANVNNCWDGAGTWMQPAKPNNVQQWEGPGSNNLGEDCRYKQAYVTTKETRRSSDGLLLSRTYTIGCFRLDPAPAQLTSNLNLTANNNWAYSNDSNTGVSSPKTYSYQNTWKSDPYGPPAGAPCVSKQALQAMGMDVTQWNAGQYANNFMQVSGSWRRCITQL